MLSDIYLKGKFLPLRGYIVFDGLKKHYVVNGLKTIKPDEIEFIKPVSQDDIKTKSERVR